MKQHRALSWTATFLPVIAILFFLLIGLSSAEKLDTWDFDQGGSRWSQAFPTCDTMWLNVTAGSSFVDGWSHSTIALTGDFDVWINIHRPAPGVSGSRWVGLVVTSPPHSDYSALGQTGYLVPWYDTPAP